MKQDCSRFKFLLAVFFFPLRSLLERIGLRYDFSSITNAYYRAAFNKVSVADRAVILPHCLIGQACKARFSKDEGILCTKCRQCRCGEIRELCEEKGWQFYISPSTNFTKRLVRRKGVQAAIGAACDLEIEKGIRSTPITLEGVRLKERRVIPQAMMTVRADCLNNDIDWERLRRMIGGDAGEP
jgi:hypothetical protein